MIEAVNHLKVRSCLIDGEVVCCDERGLTVRSAWVRLTAPVAPGLAEVQNPQAPAVRREAEEDWGGVAGDDYPHPAPHP